MENQTTNHKRDLCTTDTPSCLESKLRRKRDLLIGHTSHSQLNASWDTFRLQSPPCKLSMHGSVSLCTDDGIAAPDFALRQDDAVNDEKQQSWTWDADMEQLLSMLHSATFIGNIDPKAHEQWLSPSLSPSTSTSTDKERSEKQSHPRFPSAC
jgi:hypothetical protein